MGENTYEAPVVNTLDGNGNGTDPNVQPADWFGRQKLPLHMHMH